MGKNVFKKLSTNNSNKFSYYKFRNSIVKEDIHTFENSDAFLVSCGHNISTSSLNDIFWNARDLSSYFNEVSSFKYQVDVNRRLFYYLSNDNENRFSIIKKEIS